VSARHSATINDDAGSDDDARDAPGAAWANRSRANVLRARFRQFARDEWLFVATYASLDAVQIAQH
jgi:hypothetical protein